MKKKAHLKMSFGGGGCIYAMKERVFANNIHDKNGDDDKFTKQFIIIEILLSEPISNITT